MPTEAERLALLHEIRRLATSTDLGGPHFTTADRQLLETLADDLAVACETALLHERVGGEGSELRTLRRLAGFGLALVGLVFAGGAIVVHQALALGLTDLPTRPGLWPGLLAILAGGLLAGASRRDRRRTHDIALGTRGRLTACR